MPKSNSLVVFLELSLGAYWDTSTYKVPSLYLDKYNRQVPSTFGLDLRSRRRVLSVKLNLSSGRDRSSEKVCSYIKI